MTKTKAGPIAGERVKSFIERVEKLLEERQAIQSDIRDVFSEAKGVGYDVKTMRKLIQIRAMDAADRDEANALLDTYAHAIGAEEIVGTFARSLSEEELIDRATKIVREVDRCMELPRDPLPAIRAIMDAIKCSSGKAHKIRHLVEERLEAMERFSRSNAGTVKSENENPPHDADGIVTDTSPKAPDASSTVTARATIEDEQPAAAIADGEAAEVAIDAPAASGSPVPAGDEAGNAGGSHDERRLIPEPEVARVVPPATEPVDWDSIIASHPAPLRGASKAAQASQSEAKRTQ